MRTLACPFPDRETLRRGLTSVFNSDRLSRARLTILRRQPCTRASNLPSEIVTCRAGERGTLWLLCKYASRNRREVPYEAEVYRQVLQPYQASTPACYGTYSDKRTGSTWLILEYLKQSVPVEEVPDSAAIRVAARWIGRFHAVHEVRLARAPIPFLTTYEAEYYVKWARRTAQLAGHWHGRFPWIAPLCKRLEAALVALVGRPPTVIHGDYFAHNVLSERGVICPVDWEDAAIAAGEIDLATLTQGWPGKIVKQLEVEYQRARWPKNAPTDFRRTLDLARAYVLSRWLGERWMTENSCLWRFERLRSVSKRLGLL